MQRESVQQATLRRARDLAGGVSFLARNLGVGAIPLDAMLQGQEQIPTWIFLRSADFINDAESKGLMAPAVPAAWLDTDLRR